MTGHKTASKSDDSRGPGRPAGRRVADGLIADRESLLTAAEELIKDEGPNISLQAIANKAGITKPILYRGVGDRDALVRALSERLASRMAERITQLVEQAGSGRESLRGFVEGYLQNAATQRNLYLFITAGGARDDRVQQSLLLADGAAAQFAEPIAAYRAAHGEDPQVATVWSYGLLGALHFATLWWLRDEATDMDQVVDQITGLLWSGLGHED
jgi:AcrR family transcriptional regulator